MTVSISIVSHRQADLVRRLLGDIEQHCPDTAEVILTENVPDPGAPSWTSSAVPLTVVRNQTAKGFGANHNAAFLRARAPFFCVLNPDIRLSANPFPDLLRELAASRVGVAAPLIVNSSGQTEDSARRFPTPQSLLKKALRLERALDYAAPQAPFSPEWTAGMFMLFHRDIFEKMRGFDERYFLYYEDIDLCARLRLAGYDVRVVPSVRATHDAQRRSHTDPRYMLWHLRSIARFFASPAFRGVMRQRKSAQAVEER
jgi:N-acetylglucosaminyl-diphospho-decaprenol L-rhamnosyltransferase